MGIHGLEGFDKKDLLLDSWFHCNYVVEVYDRVIGNGEVPVFVLNILKDGSNCLDLIGVMRFPKVCDIQAHHHMMIMGWVQQ